MNELTVKKPEEMTAEELGADIRNLTRQAKVILLDFGIQIGYRLKLVQEKVEHFAEWVEGNTEFSKSSAYRYIRLYEEYGGQIGLFGVDNIFPTLGKLSISNALRMLAVPEEEREEFAEKVNAENISARELEKAIAEKKAAEEAVRAANAEKQRIAGDLKTAQAERDRLTQENRELRSRPVEVAVEPESEESIAKRVAERTRTLEAAQGEERRQMQEAVEGWKEKLREAEEKANEVAALQTQVEELKKKIAESGTAELEEKLRKTERELEESRMKQVIAAVNTLANQGAKAFAEAAEKIGFIGDEEMRQKVAGALRKMLESVMAEF